MNVSERVEHKELKLLAKHGLITSVEVVGAGDSFFLTVKTSGKTQVLHNRSGEIRNWKRLETLLGYMREELGVSSVTLNLQAWNPSQKQVAL